MFTILNDLNELSQELDNLYSLYAGKKVKTRCRDLYNVHKRVIKIDIFRGVSLITVCIKWDNRKQFFYYTKENRTSELMFSQRILSVSEGVLLVGPIKPVYNNVIDSWYRK